MDQLLLESLLRRWWRQFLSKRGKWADRALFRSLNMAMHAAKQPGGVDTTIYDIGRSLTLWISACEILVHPGRKGGTGIHQVYDMLERVSYNIPRVGNLRYKAFVPKMPRKKLERRSLPCWIYGEMYKLRNTFLHGNPLDIRRMVPKEEQTSLFSIAPCVYRLALTGFLNISTGAAETEGFAAFQASRVQGVIEDALLKCR